MHQINLRLKIKTYRMWLKKILAVLVLLISSVTLSVMLAFFLAKGRNNANHVCEGEFFSDVSLCSPVYFECRHLIEKGIIRKTGVKFEAFKPIEPAYWNFVVKGIEAESKARFPASAYFKFKEELTEESIRKKCIAVALGLGISPGIDNIPERAFRDISKINILSILDNYLSISNKADADEA